VVSNPKNRGFRSFQIIGAFLVADL
jgi:hypothetical protein